MVWIRLSICCIAFLSIAGSIAYGIVRLAEKSKYIENPALLLALQKLALVLYWVPIPFIWIYTSRLFVIASGGFGFKREFGCSTTPSMTITFYLVGAVWLEGFLSSVVKAGIKRRRLAELVRGNVPVQNPLYLDIFEACARQYGLDGIMLSQNDLLKSPVTLGLVRKQIILPFADYTETELRMIYEHELTHIKNKDILWRMLALVTSWVHWFNPVIRMHLNELDCIQEIVCDLSIAIDNARYTKKEYIVFLAKLTDKEAFNAYTLALTENKHQTTRRIQEMVKTVKMSKLKKRIVGVNCACLAVFTLIPTTVVSEEFARLQECWIEAEGISVEAEPQDFSDSSIEEHGYDDGNVVEIDGSQDIAPYATKVELDKTINANTRQIYQYKSKTAGDVIVIVAECDDSAVTYKIGIKNKETGERSWISGTGLLNHEFKVSESGTYSAYVENNNNFSINVTGSAIY